MVTRQPRLTEAERAPGALGSASSFTIELADESVLLKIRMEDGTNHAIELTPDMALYLREYLTNALATIGYFEN